MIALIHFNNLSQIFTCHGFHDHTFDLLEQYVTVMSVFFDDFHDRAHAPFVSVIGILGIIVEYVVRAGAVDRIICQVLVLVQNVSRSWRSVLLSRKSCYA